MNQLIEVRREDGHEVSTGSDSDRVSTVGSSEVAISKHDPPTHTKPHEGDSDFVLT